MLLVGAEFRLGRRKTILGQLGANIFDEGVLGGQGNCENSGQNSGEDGEAPLFRMPTHRSMMNQAAGTCKRDAQAARLYRRSAWTRMPIIWWNVAMSKSRMERFCTSPATTAREGLNSLN